MQESSPRQSHSVMYHACIHTHRFCAECGTPEFVLPRPLSACGRCCISWYCSKECQSNAWEEHKKFCSPLLFSDPAVEDEQAVADDATVPPAINLHDGILENGQVKDNCSQAIMYDSIDSDETPTQSPVSGAATPVAVHPSYVVNNGLLTPPTSPPPVSPGVLSVRPSTPLTPVNSKEEGKGFGFYSTPDGNTFATSHLLGSSSDGRAADTLGPFQPTADMAFEQALDSALMGLCIGNSQ